MNNRDQLFGPPPLVRRARPVDTKEIEVDVPGQGGSYHVFSARIRAALTLAGIVLWGLLAARLVVLQIIEGERWRAFAENNRLRIEVLPASRGAIIDRHGNLVAGNIPLFTLEAGGQGMAYDADARAQHLARVEEWGIALDGESRQAYLEGESQGAPRIIAEGLTPAQTALVMSHYDELPDLRVVSREQRSLPDDESFAHAVGYTGKLSSEEWRAVKGSSLRYQWNERVGKTGIEQAYETELRGRPGRVQIEVDARGRGKEAVAEEQPRHGTPLRLTLDAELQGMAVRALNSAMRDARGSGGAVIVMDPRTGEVLALASAPQFHVRQFANGEPAYVKSILTDARQPLFNRALAGQYPIGSTIKPMVAAAALQEGIITARTRIFSSGGLRVGDWFFPDWKARGHGWADLNLAIAESVNTYFYEIGGGYEEQPGLGVERMARYARLFGLDAVTGIDVAGEKSGFIPTPAWKEETKGEPWYIGDTYHFAIGQGDVLATPLQVARMTSAIANGGYLVTPRLVMRDAVPAPQRIAPVSAETLQEVMEAMRQTVTTGSARSLGSLSLAVAGKTGTAQVGGDKPPHAWFTGFAPFDNPEIAVTVLIEHGGEGSVAAVPVARDIFMWWASHGHKDSSNGS